MWRNKITQYSISEMPPNLPGISIFLSFLVGFYCYDNDYYESIIEDYGEIVEDKPTRILSVNSGFRNSQPSPTSEDPEPLQEFVTEVNNPCKDAREEFIKQTSFFKKSLIIAIMTITMGAPLIPVPE